MIPINNLKVIDLSIIAENCRLREQNSIGNIGSESYRRFAVITTTLTPGHTFTVSIHLLHRNTAGIIVFQYIECTPFFFFFLSLSLYPPKLCMPFLLGTFLLSFSLESIDGLCILQEVLTSINVSFETGVIVCRP